MAVSLFDLAPRKHSISLSVGEVEYGHIATSHLPELIIGNLAMSKIFEAGDGAETVSILDIARASPKLVAEVIALGCGFDGYFNEAQSRVDEILPAPDQLALFQAIVDVSFPQGVADFLARLFSGVAKAVPAMTNAAEKTEAQIEMTLEQAQEIAASA